MNRLTLLRHAKSSWDHPGLKDLERPLNNRGERDAPLMGRVCAENLPKPDLILFSPSRRTTQTVNLLTDAWNLETARLVAEDRLYLAGADEWEEIINHYAPEAEHILGCAHQPGIGDFACWLDASFTMSVPTAAVISFSIPEGKPGRNCARLKFYGIPRDYR